MSRTNRKYDEEFKHRAVKLYLESGKSYPVLSEELGVPSATLAGWVNNPRYKEIISTPAGEIEIMDELKKLRKELKDVREERDILKKVVAIFSRTKENP